MAKHAPAHGGQEEDDALTFDAGPAEGSDAAAAGNRGESSMGKDGKRGVDKGGGGSGGKKGSSKRMSQRGEGPSRSRSGSGPGAAGSGRGSSAGARKK